MYFSFWLRALKTRIPDQHIHIISKLQNINSNKLHKQQEKSNLPAITMQNIKNNKKNLYQRDNLILIVFVMTCSATNLFASSTS